MPSVPPTSERRWVRFLQRWLVTTLAVLVAAHVVKGISYDSAAGLFVASLLLGILNAFVRPVMLLLSLPILVYSLGLFVLFINAFLLYLVGHTVRGFHVEGFWAAFWGGLVISLTSLVVTLLTGTSRARFQFRRGSRPPSTSGPFRRPPPDGPSGPIIDV